MGLDIDVCGLSIKNYKLRELVKYGLDRYRHLLSLTILKPKDVLDIDKSQLKDVDMYDVVCVVEPLRQWFIDMMHFLTGITFEYNDAFMEFVLYTDDGRIVIDKTSCEEIFSVIKKMYCLSNEKSKDEIDVNMAVDEEVKELAKEFADFKKEQVSKGNGDKITLTGIIRAISTSNMGYKWNDVYDMSMYCLIETYNGMQLHDNYRYTMTGLYSGCLDSKSINLKELNYAKDID